MDKEIYKINDNFSIKVIRDLDEFRKLEDIWNSLAESCESYTPWLSFDWFNLCLKYSLATSRLLIILFYKADRILAIAPFVVKNEIFRGFIQTKKIELLG